MDSKDILKRLPEKKDKERIGLYLRKDLVDQLRKFLENESPQHNISNLVGVLIETFLEDLKERGNNKK